MKPAGLLFQMEREWNYLFECSFLIRLALNAIDTIMLVITYAAIEFLLFYCSVITLATCLHVLPFDYVNKITHSETLAKWVF